MRVLHVYKTYYPDTYGGIEQVIYQLSQGCARRGIAADVFTFSPDKETGPVAYEDHRVIYNKQLFEIASTPFSLKALKRFKQIKDDYDIINYHFPFPFMDMLHLSARPDARTVVTYHSDIVKQKRLMKLYQPLQERFLASVDCIVASSPNYVASSQTLKKYQDKTVVIPFGLEQHDVQHDPQRVAHWRETVGDNFFLFVGAFRYYKGLHILLDDMAETLADANGAGLAAPQVGVLRRVCLVLDEESEEFLELINPEIIVQSGEQTGLEGCLSVPGKWGIVTRPNRVRVRAQDRDGAWFEAEAEGLTARAFCHEIEHLDGHLFIEHIDHFLTEEELKEYLEDEE